MPRRDKLKKAADKKLATAALTCKRIDGLFSKGHQNVNQSESPVVVDEDNSNPSNTATIVQVDQLTTATNGTNILEGQQKRKDPENNLDPEKSKRPKVDLYKGYSLDKNILLDQLKWIKTTRPNPKGNTYGYCSICQEYQQEAISESLNGRLPIAFKPGIRFSGEEYLKRFIDHEISESHKKTCQAKRLKDAWKSNLIMCHPWLKSMKKFDQNVCEMLVHLTIDAYNDLRIGTLSRRSWPSRYLSQLHVKGQVIRMKNKEIGAQEFEAFVPTSSDLHYVSPEKYTEICEIIGKFEIEKLKNFLETCTNIGIQVDGSQDRMACDVKHVTARLWQENKLKTVFLGVYEPKAKGADGLLESIEETFKKIKCPIEKIGHKLNSITTDGENANTGNKGGLWVKLAEKLGKELITIWCSCHRADLVYSKMEKEIPELDWWKSDVKNISSYFRSAKSRLKELKKIALDKDPKMIIPEDYDQETDESDYSDDEHVVPQSFGSLPPKSFFSQPLKRFPRYFEVRMAEHLLRLVVAMLGNLNYCAQYFDQQIEKVTPEKPISVGYLNKITDDHFLHFSCFMVDILRIFQDLEKKFQSESILITEVKGMKLKAMLKLRNLEDEAYPNGVEEEFLKLRGLPLQISHEKFPTYVEECRVVNKYIPFKRSFTVVRQEIIMSALTHMNSQLEVTIISELDALVNAKTAKEVAVASAPFYEKYKLVQKSQIYDEACSLEIKGQLPLNIKLAVVAENSKEYQELFKIYCAIQCAAPHSMFVERVVSMYNKVKTSDRSSTLTATMNHNLWVKINGVGTAYFDPFPVVARFLSEKDRRNKPTNPELYATNRSYVKKFFHPSGC